jgi:hypothetical protein
VGTTFSVTLNELATVDFSFTGRVDGRTTDHKCVAKSAKNATHKVCERTVVVGTLGFTGHPGMNKVAFQGRVSRLKRLESGRYTLVITATNAAGQRSTRRNLTFTVLE